jgi:hypothetical protein
MKLMRAHALLGRAKKVRGKQPYMQRDMGSLTERAYANSELPAAVPAVIPARSHGFAVKGFNGFELTAERANGAIGPALRFEVAAGRSFVFEDGVG